ncbi:MAG TPA: cytochrome c [Chitinophagaceae bacterium]|nr:cytochrome c [Chitinophagaceae bacterium]
MNKFLIVTGCIALTIAVTGCGDHRNPGRAYMPDMTYSNAYETYAPAQSRLDNSEAQGAHFNGRPVEGAIARGDMFAYALKNDTTGYKLSASVRNPLDTTTVDHVESERLYLVNCAICHGTKLDGNGPLWKDGTGPFPAAPKNLMAPDAKTLAEGTMFHVVTYGKNAMGSYASQLSTAQRWMVVAYIKSKQGGGASPAADSSGAAKPDSAAKATAMK